MKKSLLSLLLAVVLISPLFASQKGDIEIVGKLGIATTQREKFVYSDGTDFSYPTNPAMAIAVEGLYYVDKALPLGLGINYQFNAEEEYTYEDSGTVYKYECGTTNIYIVVKPTAQLDSKIFNSIYAIGQLGLGMNRVGGNGYDDRSAKNGLYWGLGAGTQIMNDFIFEFVFATNYCKYHNDDDDDDNDVTKTALNFYVGYKFAI